MTNQLHFRPQPVRMSLVSRAKLVGVGKHYGVCLEYSPTWREILDLQEDDGLRVVPVETFAHGHKLWEELVLSGLPQTGPAWARVRELVSKPPSYDLLKRNCEHIARRVMTGLAQSSQVSTWVFVAGAVALMALFSEGD